MTAYRDEIRHALETTGAWPEPRYRCIRGPGGLVRAVVERGRIISRL